MSFSKHAIDLESFTSFLDDAQQRYGSVWSEADGRSSRRRVAKRNETKSRSANGTPELQLRNGSVRIFPIETPCITHIPRRLSFTTRSLHPQTAESDRFPSFHAPANPTARHLHPT